MKKLKVLSGLVAGLFIAHHAFAADTNTINLKRKCLNENPLVVGETDQLLLSSYEKICDKKFAEQKNAYLVLAAQRFQQLGRNLKALELINHLESQNLHSNTLTDVKFLAGAEIANAAVKRMRDQEVRYLTSDSTYPVAKTLADAIESAKPAPVLKAEEMADSDTSKAGTKYKNMAKANKVKATSKTKQNATASKSKSVNPVTQPAKASSGSSSSSNPFASLH